MEMKDTPTNTPISELEKKQLKELHHDIFTCFTSISYQDSAVVAESLYNKGYTKQKEGEWIKNDHGDTICSCCRLPVNCKSKFCPDCGVKMKGS